MGISKLCRYLREENLPLLINIIGRMGSGKSTLARGIYRYCFEPKGFAYREATAEDIDTMETWDTGRPSYVLFDDFSFQITGRDEESRRRLNKLFRVRHILRSDDIVLVFVVHYMRSIAPFLRYGQVKILTSITPAEIKAYASEYLFTMSSLWDYLYYFNRYPDRYIVLYGGSHGEHIIDVTEKTRGKNRSGSEGETN